MKRTVLQDQGSTIYTEYLPVRKRFLHDFQRQDVRRIVIGWNQYGSIEHEKVGIGGRQPLSIVIIFSCRPGQGKQAEPREGSQFGFHGLKITIVLVARIIAGDIYDGSFRTEAGQRIDVCIGVITRQGAVGKPENRFHSQLLAKPCFKLIPGQMRIAVGIEQAFRSGQQGAFPVAFNAAAQKPACGGAVG
jgi:hypothetical protein